MPIFTGLSIRAVRAGFLRILGEYLVRSRRAKGAGTAAVLNDLIWIGVVLRAAKSVKALPVNPSVV
jgi:hypothetical protein